MDSAPSHVTSTTVQWLKNHQVKWIPKLYGMANSPDLAPTAYAINANFKRILKKGRTHTTTELARVIQREWKKIDVKTCRNALACYKFRVQTMLERQGSRVE